MKITDLKVNPRNPRVIKDSKFKKLVKSLQDFPQMMELRPIIIDDGGVIQGGNMRFRALQELGYKEIPDTWVKQGKDLTPEQWAEFVVKDNLSFGEWDFDILSADYEAPELEGWGFDFGDMLEVQDDNEAKDDGYEIPEHITTDIQPGDLFEIGAHRLLCGDSEKPDDLARLFAGKKADLVVTDPPYNVDYVGKTADALKIENDKMTPQRFLDFLINTHKATAEHTKPGGAWYVWHADSEGLNFRRAFQEAGLDLKQTLIWVKNTIVMGRQDYQWKHEPCLYGWKPGAAHYFTPDRTLATVIDDKLNINKLSKDEMKQLLKEIFSEKSHTSIIYHDKPSRSAEHPTMKPVPLMGYLIKNSSKPMQVVADPFLGSGSTMVAAHQLKRRCFGLELDPKYCQVILDRMKKLDPELIIVKKSLQKPK